MAGRLKTVPRMSARAEPLGHNMALTTPLRWLGAAAVVAAAVTALSRLRDRSRQPSLTPMSSDWLQSLTANRHYHHSHD